MTFRFIPRLSRDTRGVSAVEFAMIAPLIILFYFALVDVSMLIQADRRLTTTASTVGDLVAQDNATNDSDMDDIFAAAKAVMEPFDATLVKMRVSSLRMDASGDIEVTWSKAWNDSPLSCGSSYTVPDGVLTPGESVILSQVELEYTPKIGKFLSGSKQLQDHFYLRPRRSLEVTYTPPMC